MATSFRKKHPDLARQWHPTKNGDLAPSQLSPGSNKKIWWICPEGHEFLMSVKKRSIGQKCSVCAGKVVLKGFNDLKTIHPKVAKTWHPERNKPIRPTQVTSGSTKKYWWKCSKGHEWQTSVANRTRGNGCPYCGGKRVIPGETGEGVAGADDLKLR